MRAVWNGRVIAESDQTIHLEGNVYFPPQSVNWETLDPSPTTSRCWWKGKATYYDIHARDRTNPDAAWTYHKPWRLARRITDHIAFSHGVVVTP